MNQFHKVIWSKTKCCYVVVSELAKSHGKSTSANRKRALVTTLVAFLATFGVTMSYAADTTPGGGSGVAIGTGSNAQK